MSTRASEGNLIGSLSEAATYGGTIGLTVHRPHSPTIPVIVEKMVDSIPTPVELYAENDIRSDAPAIGARNGWENWRRPGSSGARTMYKVPEGDSKRVSEGKWSDGGSRTFTNTPMDTPNNRMPNWNARKPSKGVRSVLGSPVVNIKSLGDSTNTPASTSSLTHKTPW